MSHTLRGKVLLATGLLAALLAASAMTRLGAVPVARALVAVLVLGGAAHWVWRRRPSLATALPSRLQVQARTGLGPRCGVALVEADGQSYLIAFGEGFAQIQPTVAAARAAFRDGGSTGALDALEKEAWS